jgi:hypothetical protein
MNIIFKDNTLQLDKKYTVLDLDTFKFPDGTIHTACCVIENLPIQEMAQTDNFKSLHANLIESYAKKNWNYCEQAIEHLMGKWGGEIDTFYQDLKKRIDSLKTQELDDSWTPIITKT